MLAFDNKGLQFKLSGCDKYFLELEIGMDSDVDIGTLLISE